MSLRKVLVLGGGIAGLSAAAALTRALATIDAAQACVDAGMPADHFTVRASIALAESY
jgi:glycine/D-amino acid oxidase-like deaminating enzyme